MAESFFDDILNLEDKFYDDGFKKGKEDGERAGKIEGRSFGFEKGFEKFAESGRLYGKSIVWANRLPQAKRAQTEEIAETSEYRTIGFRSLPRLSGGARLEKNIVTLHALVEPDTLSTDNNDESVNDFDDRVKRAQGKTKVIERQIGEDAVKDGGSGTKEAAEASLSKSPTSKEAVSF